MLKILVLSLAACSCFAAQLAVLAYDMPNGYGQASGGSFNYWDRNYSGIGSTTTDGSPLSGGTGDLTDGVIATQNWLNVENVAGTGPYVGWLNVNPTIIFRFAAAVNLTSVVVHADDSQTGGVAAPASIDFGLAGQPLTNYPVTDPPGVAPFSFTINANLTGQLYEMRVNRSSPWIFVSEIEFFGDAPTAVPEPATTAIVAIAFIVGSSAARRRRVARTKTAR